MNHKINPDEFIKDNYLTTAQAAYMLNLATGTLQNWRSSGIGPEFIRHRRRIYYLKSEIYSYIENNVGRFSSTAEYKDFEP